MPDVIASANARAAARTPVGLAWPQARIAVTMGGSGAFPLAFLPAFGCREGADEAAMAGGPWRMATWLEAG